MVRAPAKTCPNLSRIFDDAAPEQLAAFIDARSFENQDWLKRYRFDPAASEAPDGAREMLRVEKKDRLSPLEAEAARIVTIAGSRGQTALEGLARTKLRQDQLTDLMGQRDEIARSLWAFANEEALFEAAENSLHLRMYRRYDKHYQTFMAEPSSGGGPDAGSAVLDALLADLNDRLDRGDGYSIDKFDIPGDDEEPPAEMYLLFHPNPPTSVRDMDDDGNRSRIYFRPPGEAMIVYTPSSGRVHVRASTRALRHTIAERFVVTALDQSYSSQPVDFQAYDIAQFLEGFDLDLPDMDDVTILRAQVIRADISVGSLANRLSLSTTIEQNISELIESQTGLARIFERAVAMRFVEIAVRYRRSGKDAQVLDFTISDRNTSSLLSLDDPFERVLGHRLLRHWGILREGRAPSAADSATVIPALLALWDIGADQVSGAWLLDRNVDPGFLTELGFLVLAGWEGDAVLDDEDGTGPVDAEVIASPDGVELRSGDGQAIAEASPDRYRNYRVRKGWVLKHLKDRLAEVIDAPAVEELTGHLLSLGTLEIDDRRVPVYFARALENEKISSATDTELRRRSHLGIGLVLQAGNLFATCLAANVLTRAIDSIDLDQPGIALIADKLRAAYRRDRLLASGGQVVELRKSGDHGATLIVPSKGTIFISGSNRVTVIERLVDAHLRGATPVKTADLTKDYEGQSLSNIFNQPLWDKLKGKYLRSPRSGRWEIAV